MPRYIEELVGQQVQRSEIARRELGAHCPGLVVTLSRGMGAGARIIAGKLASDLGWSLWDKELIDAMAENADVSRRVVEAFDERTISEIELLTRSVLGDYEMGGFLYARHLAKALYSIAKLGNAIILGRGANLILQDALSIRIEASMEVRIRNMMTFEGLNYEEAEAKVKQSDHDREHFLLNTFGRDRVQRSRHDLTLYMDRFTNDDAVAIIKAAIQARCNNPGAA